MIYLDFKYECIAKWGHLPHQKHLWDILYKDGDEVPDGLMDFIDPTRPIQEPFIIMSPAMADEFDKAMKEVFE